MNVPALQFKASAVLPAAFVVLFPSQGACLDEDGEEVLIIPEVEVEERAPDEEEGAEHFSLTPGVHENVEETPGVNVTTEEILESSPSVRVKKFGSYGAPSLLSLRGSDATHTLVLLDDIPLNEASSGLVDLSTIPSFLLESVHVYRGFVASSPSPFHPGGVVKFDLKRPEPGVHGSAHVKLGVFPMTGTKASGESAGQELKPAASLFRFGALRQILLSSSVFNGKLGYLVSGSIEQGDGDFAYFNDNGTVYNPADDHFLERKNNHHSSISAFFTLLYLPDLWSELKVSFLEFDRSGGVPGLDVIQAGRTRLHTGRQYLKLTYQRYGELYDVPALSAGAFLKSSSIQWLDPLGEISNARQDSRSRSLGSGIVLSGYKQLGKVSTLVWGANAGLERWDGETGFSRGDANDQEALRFAAGWTITCFITALDGKIRLQGSMRSDLIGDRVRGDEHEDMERVNEYFISPGSGLEFNPFGWLSLSFNVSWNHRPATLVELFGNRGVIVGNADLEPEQALSIDVGAVFDFASLFKADKLEIEYRFFRSRITNLITFIQNSQKTMVARNIGVAEIRGAELSLAAGFLDMIKLRFGYTFLDPRDRSAIEPYDGRMLPNRPRHDIFFDSSLTGWSITLSYKLDFLSGGYIDRASMRPIAERVVHSAAVEWEPGFLKGFYAGIELWNLANFIMVERKVVSGERTYAVKEAVSDVEGYPLPGFGVYVSAGFRR